MDELIESPKQQDELTRQQLNTQNRIRLHDETIIRAKATDFWDLVQEHIQRLCGEMREAFPDNANRQLFVQALSVLRSSLSDSEREQLLKNTRLGVDGIYGVAKKLAEVHS